MSEETYLNNKNIWVICFTDFIELVTNNQLSLTRENYSRIGILIKLHPSENGLNIYVKGKGFVLCFMLLLNPAVIGPKRL